MESWISISLILCTFGFLKELRPSEPFVTEYIIEYKNITVEEVIHVAFPVSTYASLASLAIIFLVTDLLRYKPIVILEGLCHVLTWGILIFAKDIVAVILLVTWNLMNYHELNYITVACVGVGAICTLFLPRVHENRQFYLKSGPTLLPDIKNVDKEVALENGNVNNAIQPEKSISVRKSLAALLIDFKAAYGDGYVLKWSIWWAIASAGQYQVINYIQALWEQIREEGDEKETLYNGAVKAVHTFLSALLSFGIGYISISWEKWGECTLTIISVVQGLMLVWMSQTNSLIMAYLSYIIFRTIHPVMITVASAEVAQRIRNDSYALIFGANTLIALGLQTVLTFTVADLKGLALDERTQYVVYGVCFILLGLLIGLTAVFSRKKRDKPAVFNSIPQVS
ncbi:Folate transporter 1 [Orchesella cincta]|uniref:Folate transporter 1 n=1 Tax=Orchesella cincta TaxID=48709 RepID=A0A1D2MNI8_ORCCI|nr:Folate transporter 1 [Orchesella cincta]